MNSSLKDDIEVQNVPVPSQIPKPVDLSGLPSHILRSSAIETLTRQNEELLARLSVAIRRLAQTEELLNQAQQRQTVIEHKLRVSQDEALILKEKDTLFANRTRDLEDQCDTLRDQLSQMESQYAELYSTSRERSASFTSSISQLGRRLTRYQKYRSKIQKITAQMQSYQSTLTHKLTEQEAITREVQRKLGAAADRLQFIAKENEKNQKQLIESYEAQLTEKQDRLIQLTKEAELLAERVQTLENEHQMRLEAENQLIAERRQRELIQERLQNKQNQFDIQMAEIRAELKSSTIENHRLSQDLEKSQNTLSQLNNENASLKEQVETLQLLWQDQQKLIEKETVKTAALQKLNQDLSSSVNSQRREIAQLQRQIEEQQLMTQKKIQMAQTEISLIGQSQDHSPTRELGRVDTLLAEIQSGFNRQLPTDILSSEDEKSRSVPSSTADSLGR